MTIHCSSESPVPRSSWIAGSATFTTVLSSMIMKSPKETAASVHHLRRASEKIARAMKFPSAYVSDY